MQKYKKYEKKGIMTLPKLINFTVTDSSDDKWTESQTQN
jgi:hypothetical protein